MRLMKAMIIKTSGIDPKKRTGSGQVIKRNAKGGLEATRSADYAGVSNESMAEDRAISAGTGDSSYQGGPAPRVGGAAPNTSSIAPLTGGTKKQVRASLIKVRRNSASPQAKRSARMLYKRDR